MVKKITIMTTKEVFNSFYNDKKLREEYHENFNIIDIEKATKDEFLMQIFLDNEAVDIRRLNQVECELLNLEWQDGYYISTWNNEYLHTEY